MNIWFTSDPHYGHKNIAGPEVSTWKSGYRTFKNVHEMNNTIVNNINKCVGEDDILYCLGDWSFGGIQNIYKFRNSIVCKTIHLIKGNHDQDILDKDCTFKDSGSDITFNPYELFTSINDAYTGYIGKNLFHLSHYSHRVWPKSHRGSMHLYGHSHGSIPDFGKSMDVGLDTHPEFRPYHIDEIIKKLSERDTPSLDHHK